MPNGEHSQARADVGVWVEDGAKVGFAKVTGVTKRRIVTNIITLLMESAYQKHFAKAV